ncbi:ABC transporter permease [Lacticaseibacillus zhaodongensis]|uniref:ABC transporter permease n=1 Tax=Lacticaseibacillus zhaodongensis TaxID=2668065 RepID=UPI0012D2D9E2|nr:ABC transporter permease [Lacticaseibacillus zhaodongensis]
MRTLAIARRVIKELFRDKRTLALMFLAPVLIMFLMKIIFGANSSTSVTIDAVHVPSAVRTELEDVKHVQVVKKSSMRAARKSLKNQHADAIVRKSGSKYILTHANTDASKTAAVKQVMQGVLTKQGVETMKQTLKLQGTVIAKQQTAIGQLTKLLPAPAAKQFAAASAGNAAAPATTHKQAAAPTITNHYVYGDKNTNFFDKMLPILMGFFVFFFVFLISGMALLKERTSGTLDRLLATPVRRSDIVFGYTIAYGLLAIIQTLIIVVVTIYALGIQIVGSLAAVIFVNFVLALVALAFGILLSTFASSEFQMMQFIPIVLVPQIFFSGIVPLDSMAAWVRDIAYILPLKYSGDAQEQIIMYGRSLFSNEVLVDLGVLMLFLVVLTVANIEGLRRYRKV